MTSREYSGVWHVVWSMFSCALLILTAPGVKALKFLKDPPQILRSHVGMNLDFNCTTDDPNATVSLLYADSFGQALNEKPVTPNKLVLRGQVFILLNVGLSDGGQYACKATDQSGQTIQSSATFLFVNAAVLPKYFVLIPDKTMYVLQGKDGKVTCECEGVQIATLKWEKQASDNTSYVAVPNSWVTNSKDPSTNRVKAVLKITNAQLAESGLYKCTVMVQPDKSDFKLIRIQVNASLLKCQACGPVGEPCGGDNVTSVECGSFADRCMTVTVTKGSNTMMMKNCANSTVHCREQSEYNPCKIAPIGASCKVTCCEGDMCNLASPSTTAAPSTTVSSPPTPPGTEPPPAVVKGRFFKVNSSPVCFGSKNNEYGRFSVPSTGDLAAIKLVHLYGYVACYSRAKWSIWGCGGLKVNVVITTSANDVILPPVEFSDAGYWSIIPGYTSLSPELVLSVFSRPRPVTSGEEFDLWYGEDFIDDREGDNRGTVCSDVYVLLF